MKNLDEWCYVSGRVSVLESRLLPRRFFARLLACEGGDDLFHALLDSPLRDYFAHQEDLLTWERQISLSYLERLTDIKRFCPLPLVCELFQSRYDFLNLKNYIKEKVLGLPWESHLLGRIRENEWDQLWHERETDLPEIFIKTVLSLKERLRGEKEAGGSIDFIVDRASLSYLSDIARQLGSPLIDTWVRRYQLVKGLEVVWRTLLLGRDREKLLTLFLRGSMDNHLLVTLARSPMEEWARICREVFPADVGEGLFRGSPREGLKEYGKVTDDHLLHEVKPAKSIPFGPERVFGYLVGLTTELFNLKLSVGGRVNRLSPALLAVRVRETYAEI